MTDSNRAIYLHRVDCIMYYAIEMIRDQSQGLMLSGMEDEAMDVLNLCSDIDDVRKKVHERYLELMEESDDESGEGSDDS